MNKRPLKSPLLFKNMGMKQKESLKAYVFFIPLVIGLLYFFIIPVFKSFLFSVSDVTSGSEGYKIAIKGFGSYFKAFNEHTSYRQTVVESVLNTVATTPLIILFSFFMASVLNQNFRGKTFFRTILFLPLALSIMDNQVISLEGAMDAFGSFKGEEAAAVSFTTQISNWLLQSGISEEIVEIITGLVDSIYSVIDRSSIQILIMLIGMQAVSPSLYEAAYVEGATPWESFWKITFPMVSPMILVCIIYTIIDSFTSQGTGVMTLINDEAIKNLDFSLSAAMGWVYFAMIAVLLAVVAGAFNWMFKHYDV